MSKNDRKPLAPLFKALVLGTVFGFLLQKGGVGKLHLLAGVLLLEDATVVKVMLTAIVTGMCGAMLLRRFGLIEYSIKPVYWRANTFGGLIFGAGFALSGYCPGTGAVALGQMNGDALFMMLGMVAGAYAYALASERIEAKLKAADASERKMRLPELLRVPTGPFAAVFGTAIVAVLWWLR